MAGFAFGAAVLVAVVLTEEGADAVATEIGDAVVAGAGEDHRIGQNELVLVDSALTGKVGVDTKKSAMRKH